MSERPGRAAADEFRDYCLELFATLSPHAGIAGIVAKRMFGGTGFSIDGKTFSIIAFDQLWLKVDDETRPAFEAAKCEIFTYESAGKMRTMSYYTVPPDAMESASLMRPWALRAWEAALRAAAAKPAKPAKAKKPEKSLTSPQSTKSATTKKVKTKPA